MKTTLVHLIWPLVALVALPAIGSDCHAPQDAHAAHQEAMAAPPRSEALGGLTIPDVPVVTQDGREVDFYSDLVAGKKVAMNFIFTTCTTICPPMGAHFAKLRQLLGDEAGTSVHLISVSVDPVTDTPARLRAWSEVFGAGKGWTLVTGSKADVTRLLKGLQVFTPDIRDHSATVLVGDDARGEWTRAYGLAPPATLLEVIEQL